MLEQWYSERRGNAKYKKIKVYTDYQEMIQDRNIDAVYYIHT